MLTTEDEAKTKRCQESFSAAYLSPTGNELTVSSGYYVQAVQSSPSHCIGSACMAWRWINSASPRVGYCGKAGDPVKAAT